MLPLILLYGEAYAGQNDLMFLGLFTLKAYLCQPWNCKAVVVLLLYPDGMSKHAPLVQSHLEAPRLQPETFHYLHHLACGANEVDVS